MVVGRQDTGDARSLPHSIGMFASTKWTASLNHTPSHGLALHLLPVTYGEAEGSHAFDRLSPLFEGMAEINGLDGFADQGAHGLAPRLGDGLQAGELVRREQDLDASGQNGHWAYSRRGCQCVSDILAC